MRSLFLIQVFLSAISVFSQNKINSYEYWFDNNYSGAMQQTISPSSIFYLTTAVSTSSLSDGLHIFHIRFRDDSMNCSVPVSQFFYKNSIVASGSNQIHEWQYWFDNNFPGAVTQTISPQSQIVASSPISTTSLLSGLHTFHVRFRDTNNTWSSVTSQFFLKTEPTSSSNNLIDSYQYWFDNNYDSAVTLPISPQSQTIISSPINTGSLTDGLHAINIRFRDTTAQWSAVLSQFFYKSGSSGMAGNKIKQWQYWFDNDFTGSVLQNISPQQLLSINLSINTSTLSNGLHQANMRFRDSLNQWSSVVSQFFYKQDSGIAAGNEIKKYQYWFDNDYSNAITQNISPQKVFQLAGNINISSLITGLHALNIRFYDKAGKWSSPLSHYFYKIPKTIITNNQIGAYRYWFDNADSNMVFVNLPAPVDPYSLSVPINMVQVQKGPHEIHFQFRDTWGLWSSATTDSIYKNPLPIALFSGNPLQFCDSGTVVFSNQSFDGDVYLWNFGDGTIDSVFAPSHTYTTTGTFSVQLTVTDTATGNDSTLAFLNYITITPTPSNAVTLSGNDSICLGQSVTLSASTTGASYLWSTGSIYQSISISSSGNYYVIVDINGCAALSDTTSIVILPLPSAPTISAGSPTTFCQGDSVMLTSSLENTYLWNNSSTTQSINVSSTGNYLVVVSNSFGCTASSQAVAVTVNPNPSVPTITTGSSTTFCEGDSVTLSCDPADSYLWNNSSTTQSITVNISGNYYVLVSNIYGCTAMSQAENVLSNPNPVVNASIATDTFCIISSTENLIGSPIGGIWSGQGVSGNTFDPSTAGIGTWNIIYSYSDSNGCSGTDTLEVFVDLCTDISDLLSNINIFAYPNPTNGEFIVLTGNVVAENIRIEDALGKTILTVKPEINKIKVNICKSESGVYFLYIQSGNSIYYNKIIKE